MSPAPSGQAAWAWLGRVAFDETATFQEELRTAILAGQAPDTLLLCEHLPVITLGRNARTGNVLLPEDELARRGVAVRRASRGGDVTYHGPGQLVGYPVFQLRRGLLGHVASLAEGLAAVLAELGVKAEWRRQTPGLWVGSQKICAFGFHIRRRVAIHGFALNVSPDLAAFSAIVPCGLVDSGVTSVAQLRGEAPPLERLAPRVASAIARAFGFSLTTFESIAK